ncbi:hypothetical protein PUN28_005236 [Cardiocondyla obscurior]|uniref:Secreted protein n=1 Tax=Cardiocondyla obscurior TaxID=286306 RepID=A0AAW2GGQ5_9HYME
MLAKDVYMTTAILASPFCGTSGLREGREGREERVGRAETVTTPVRYCHPLRSASFASASTGFWFEFKFLPCKSKPAYGGSLVSSALSSHALQLHLDETFNCVRLKYKLRPRL